MSPRRVATIDLPAALGQSWSQASVYDQSSLRDEDALLLAFRALKRTAKFRSSLRDEENAPFAQKLG
jgi:hypothetical protein